MTALHYAALFGDVDFGRALLAHGRVRYSEDWVVVLALGYGSHTPIDFALGARRVSMCKMLLQHEAERRNAPVESIWVDVTSGFYDPSGRRATQYLEHVWLEATSCEDPKDIISMMQCLSRVGCRGLIGPKSWEALGRVVAMPHAWASLRRQIVASMLEEGARVLPPPLGPFPRCYKGRNMDGCEIDQTTPLYDATCNNATDIIPLLLERNGEEQLRALSRRHCTRSGDYLINDRVPIYIAIQRALDDRTSSLDTVQALLEGGTDLNDDNFEYHYRVRRFRTWPQFHKKVTMTAMKLAQEHVSQRPDLLALLRQHHRQSTSDIQMPASSADELVRFMQSVYT